MFVSSDVYAPPGSYYGGGGDDQPIVLDDVHCTGNETSLLDCPALLTHHNCNHTEDASVKCFSSKLYLVIDRYSYSSDIKIVLHASN